MKKKISKKKKKKPWAQQQDLRQHGYKEGGRTKSTLNKSVRPPPPHTPRKRITRKLREVDIIFGVQQHQEQTDNSASEDSQPMDLLKNSVINNCHNLTKI